MDKVYAVVKSVPTTYEWDEFVKVVCSTYDRAIDYIKNDMGYVEAFTDRGETFLGDPQYVREGETYPSYMKHDKVYAYVEEFEFVE